MTRCRLIAYFRVSTDKQGRSGLGLEAQKEAVSVYARQSGCYVAAEYTEIESGKRADRPELAKAIAHARRAKATLVIAKLDRLSRNVAFLANLMESSAEFVCCDNPTATRLTLHILAAVAEDEARRISERTKAALAAYKARGGILGGQRPECRRLTPEARQKGARAAGMAAQQAATEAYQDLGPRIANWRAEGLSLRAVAERLNADGETTRNGKPWNAVQVLRVLERFSA
jgi:DNA invertase Pin-like site-specific DNA recombinase